MVDFEALVFGPGEGFTGHSARAGMARGPVAWGAELCGLMVSSRRRSSRMPARYSEREVADRGLVAQYYAPKGA